MGPLAPILACASLGGTVLYVSPKGSDSASGRFGHPVATLEKAVLLSRSASRPVRIVAAGGRYEPARPLELKPEDSGLAIEAQKGEKPVFYGSRRVTGWKADARGWLHATVPPELRDSVQLWVNGARRMRARLPQKGVYRIEGFIDRDPKGPAGCDSFLTRPGEVYPGWQDLKGIDVMAVHQWFMSRNRIAEVHDGVVKLQRSTGYSEGWAQFRPGSPYWLENVREGLGVPGRWVLNHQTGELIYVPLPGEDLNKDEARLPLLQKMVVIRGEPGRPVEGVALKGLEFRQTSWQLASSDGRGLGRFFPQAEADLRGAVTVDHAKGLRLEKLAIQGTGEYGIDLGEDVQGSLISECLLSDLGAGGVKIGLMRNEADTSLQTSGNRVVKCQILHGGRLHPAGVGVWIGQSHHNEVRSCLISDFFYSGISIGWSWGYAPSDARRNHVAFCRIAGIGHGLLSDMGGIYTLGLSEGTVLEGCVISDVESSTYGGWGIYTDEGSSGILIRNNVVYRTSSAGFHQHYGRDNTVTNNVFAFGREAQIMRTREEDHVSFSFTGNLVYWSGAPLLGSNWSNGKFVIDRNIYWRTDGRPVDFKGQTLDQWRARGFDRASLVADPLFRDPLHGGFGLKAGSPAARIGYREPDLTAVPKTVPPDAEPSFPVHLQSGPS